MYYLCGGFNFLAISDGETGKPSKFAREGGGVGSEGEEEEEERHGSAGCAASLFVVLGIEPSKPA